MTEPGLQYIFLVGREPSLTRRIFGDCHKRQNFKVNFITTSDSEGPRVYSMSKAIVIEKWNEATDGALSVENMGKKLRKQGYHDLTQYTFEPGTSFPDHTHSMTKKDSIFSGEFQINMFGESVIMQPGDIVEVPKNTVHNAKVVGNKPVIFYDSK